MGFLVLGLGLPPPTGSHPGPDGLPSRPAGLGAGRPPVGPGGFRCRDALRAAPKERHAGDPPLVGDEPRALRALQKAHEGSRYIFATERGGPLTRSGVNKLVAPAGQLAKFRFPVTPPPPAPARLRLLRGQQRHPDPAHPVLFGSQEHCAHGPIHRTVGPAV